MHNLAPPYSRNHAQHLREEGLHANREGVAREDPTAICIEMKRLGYYSAKTSTCDIRVAYLKACRRLGLAIPRI
jgi:hypothetical protein